MQGRMLAAAITSVRQRAAVCIDSFVREGCVLLARQVRFICPHCGAINRSPIRNIGRGGTCVRCNGGVKVPAAHDGDEGELDGANASITPATPPDLISQGFETANFEAAFVELFDPGRPTRAHRSVTAPSAVVADATMLPTAAQLASSDRADRNVLPPVQTLRTLRRFARNSKPRRHVAARRQQPGTPWWAWVAHGTLSVAAMYVLTSLYNGNFSTHADAYPASIRSANVPTDVEEMDAMDATTTSGTPTTLPTAITDANGSPDDAAIATIVAMTPPDERAWIRYERILLPNRRQAYAVTRITQSRDGKNHVDRVQTFERPADFPEDAPIVDHRQLIDAPPGAL